MFQMKGQYKTPETEFNEMAISNLQAKKFKMTIIKLLTEVRRKKCMTKMRISTEAEYVRKYQT